MFDSYIAYRKSVFTVAARCGTVYVMFHSFSFRCVKCILSSILIILFGQRKLVAVLSLVCGLCTVYLGFFAFPLGVIAIRCAVIVATSISFVILRIHKCVKFVNKCTDVFLIKSECLEYLYFIHPN